MAVALLRDEELTLKFASDFVTIKMLMFLVKFFEIKETNFNTFSDENYHRNKEKYIKWSLSTIS